LFYLWSPHSLNAQFNLSRINLPPYTTQAVFEEGRSDFPTNVLEKLAAKQLAEISPGLQTLYAHFTIDTATQERLMSAIEVGGQTAMQAVCGWLTTEQNAGVWRRWLPSNESNELGDRPPADRPPCSDSEEASLTLGMRASKLDDRESLANLVGSGDVKQALRSLVGVLSTGGDYGDDAVCTWLIAPPDASNVTVVFRSLTWRPTTTTGHLCIFRARAVRMFWPPSLVHAERDVCVINCTWLRSLEPACPHLGHACPCCAIAWWPSKDDGSSTLWGLASHSG
jgi:hypothetical protein